MTAPEINITTNEFSLAKHNATITMLNPATRGHLTFRIRTIKRGNLDGKRFVELLTGSDNLSAYQAWGFVEDDGSITVWKRFQGSVHEKFADMLCHPEKWTAKGVKYMFALRCRRCGRLLSHPDSVTSGFGPECIKYVQE